MLPCLNLILAKLSICFSANPLWSTISQSIMVVPRQYFLFDVSCSLWRIPASLKITIKFSVTLLWSLGHYLQFTFPPAAGTLLSNWYQLTWWQWKLFRACCLIRCYHWGNLWKGIRHVTIRMFTWKGMFCFVWISDYLHVRHYWVKERS